MDFPSSHPLFTLLLLWLLACGTPIASAKPFDQTTLSLSNGLLHFDYQETKSGSTLNEETGLLPTFSLNACGSKNTIELCSGYQIASAIVQYDGQLQNGFPNKTDTKMRLQSFNADIKSEFLLDGTIFKNSNGDSNSSTPIKVALIYRYWRWDRDIQDSKVGRGLSEVYFWQELGIEMGIPIQLFKQTESLFSTKVFRIVQPTMDIYTLNVTDLNLRSKNGVELAWSTDFFKSNTNTDMLPIKPKPSFNIKAFIKYYEFGSSKPKPFSFWNGFTLFEGTIIEPDSRTYLFGISLSFYVHSFF